MKIQNLRKRKAISPVLATVILIAITLIAAIAIAGFVFGLFGTFTGGQHLQIVAQRCDHAALAANKFYTNALTPGNACLIAVANTGGSDASITSCTIYGATYLVAGAPVVVPAGTTSAAPKVAECDSTVALVSGAEVTGQYVVASGSPLSFSAISGP